jgi:uncharacterized protein (TIGR02145 family)
MTQNLRTKTYADGITTLTQGSNADPNVKFYNYPDANAATFADHPEYGLLYTWPAASGRTDHTEGEANNPDQQQYQGICPDDWHLPSDYEWNQLEEAIAKSAANEYSTTGPTTWNSNYSTSVGNVRGYHGRKMKSATAVNSQATNGTSKPYNQNGFDVLLVGAIHNGEIVDFGLTASLWTSSSYAYDYSWRRYLNKGFEGMYRGCEIPRYNLRSVRCKKD